MHQTQRDLMATNVDLQQAQFCYSQFGMVGPSYGGDISYGRLNKIPWQPIQWYHAVAPLVLVVLTRFGVPVSTTFLVLSCLASTVVLEKVLLKSALGYLVAASACIYYLDDCRKIS